MSTTVCALLTVHNRRELTLRCLKSLSGCRPDAVDLTTILVDDGSSDGTTEAVRAAFPDTRIVPGTGNLYWTGGMALAEDTALRLTNAEFLLWVNDDVDLYPDALARLLDTALSSGSAPIVVGTFVDPDTGLRTYGGYRRRDRRRPMRYVDIEPKDDAQVADTFNGNLVLVPRAVAEALGGIDRRYPHALADLDYGLRARRLGVRVLVAPGIAGACINHVERSYNQPGLRLRQRVAIMHQTRHLPWKARTVFLRRHGGPIWPVLVPSVYVRLIRRHLMDRLDRARRVRD